MKKHLFIVTYGRTGSTLLMGLLNAHPKILIHGENHGFFRSLYESLAALDEFESQASKSASQGTASPFFGASKFPHSDTRENILQLMDQCVPKGAETVGFKEIRYDMPDLDNCLDFLRNRYENTKFVFLTRDHAAVATSGFFKEGDPERITRYLGLIESRFCAYISKHEECCFEIDYRELMDFASVSNLFSFLGYEISADSWKEVIAKPHSYDLKSSVEISTESNLVLFDGLNEITEVSKFRNPGKQLKNMSALKLRGVIVPKADSGAITSLQLRSPERRHQATLGIPSPGMAAKFPEHPFAANARFDFASDPPEMKGPSRDFDLVAVFSGIGERTIGRLFIS